MTAPLPDRLETAAADQPAARAALAAALAAGPAHAYELIGPSGTGKRAVARALAAELLAEGAPDPDPVRRRVLGEQATHPDLAILRPPGNQHLVEEVRERVISAVSYRPFEAERRVFIIESADAMAEESQNALLKTLEEPPSYVHILLVSSDPSGLLETVRSRCQSIRFDPLPREAVERRLAEGTGASLPPETIAALAALADGDLSRARFLASERGSRLRELAEACCRAAVAGTTYDRPWTPLMELATDIGKEEGAAVEAAAASRAEDAGKGKDATRIKREGAEAGKRADRRARTGAIDLSLALVASWFIDLVAFAEGVPAAARNLDRTAELEADSKGLDPAAARAVAERAMATRRRLQVNVNEDLALDALFHGAAAKLGNSASVL